MYLLYSDESNFEPQKDTFFIYGGIIIDSNRAQDLSDKIQLIRDKHKIPASFVLKFKPRPSGIDEAIFIDCKKRIIRAAVDCDYRLSLSLIHHGVASDPSTARRNEINRISYNFNCYLKRKNKPGIILFDRFDDIALGAQLREMFSAGLHRMPYGDPYKLDKILGYHLSAIGQSHFTTISDIVICSFRFAVNAFCRNEKAHLPTASMLLRQIAPLFERDEENSKVYETSLCFSPKIIRNPVFFNEYEKLKQFLAVNGVPAAQIISGQRLY